LIAAARWRRLGLAAALLASGEAALFYLYWWSEVFRAGLRGPDFFSFYAAARLFDERGGAHVYDARAQFDYQQPIVSRWPNAPHGILPYIHPPYYTLLIAPLGRLDYPTAYVVMAVANLVLAVAAVILLAHAVRLSRLETGLLALLVAGYLPLFVTLLQGQSDLVMLVPLAGAFAAWSAGREATAGALAGLAMVKPQLLLLVPVLFVVRRSWRAVLGFAGVAAVLAAVSLAFFGVAGITAYAKVVLPWLGGGTTGFPITGQSVFSLRGFLEALPGGHVTALALLALLLLGAGVLLALTRPGRELEFGLAVAASVALSPYQNLHDLLLLVLPLLVLARSGPGPALLTTAAVVAIDVTLLAGTLPAALAVLAVAGALVLQTSMKSRFRQAR
jgi:hypothetical protein